MNGGLTVGDACRVCGDPTTEHSNASCTRCFGVFHLALRQDIPAKDCGQVWINDEHMALEFACNLCLISAGEIPAPAEGVGASKRRYAKRTGTRASQVVRERQPGRR